MGYLMSKNTSHKRLSIIYSINIFSVWEDNKKLLLIFSFSDWVNIFLNNVISSLKLSYCLDELIHKGKVFLSCREICDNIKC